MVRIWCVPVSLLDRQHLLGEHRELHVIFGAIIKFKRGIKAGWQRHPQTLRFMEHLGMLVSRHREQVFEMSERGYKHQSPLILNDAYEFVEDFNAFESYTYTKEQFLEDFQLLMQRNGLQKVKPEELGKIPYSWLRSIATLTSKP